MKINRYFFLFLVIFSINNILAQDTTKKDSLITIFNGLSNDTLKIKMAHTIAGLYGNTDPMLALQYARKGLELSSEINYKYGTAKSNFYIGKYFLIENILDSAEVYFTKSLHQFIKIENIKEEGYLNHSLLSIQHHKGNYNEALQGLNKNIIRYSNDSTYADVLARLYHLQGIIYQSQTKYELGIESIIKALMLTNKLSDPVFKAKILGALGNLYHYTNNKEKALEYFEQSIVFFEQTGNKKSLANALNNIGNTYYTIEKYDKALYYLEKSLPISQEFKFNNLIAITSFNIGKTYVRLDRVNEGIILLKKSLDISQNITKNPREEVWALCELGKAFNLKNQPLKAVTFLDKAVKISDSISIKDDLSTSYLYRSQSYEILGDYQKSLEDHKRYFFTRNDIYNITKTKEIERLTTIYETEKKEQQIALHVNEIDLLEEKAKVNNLQRALLGSGLALSIGIIGLVFYVFRQKIKRKKLEKEKVDTLLRFKKKELTTHALHLAKKNEVLEGLKEKAEALKKTENNRNGYQQLIQTINFDLQDDNNWDNFTRYFEQVHRDFNSNVKNKYPKVTSNELRLMALLKMNLTSKEIANILNISQDGIKKARQRLRKKLQLSPQDSLSDTVISI